MLIRSLLIFIEVSFITILNYYMAESYYSLDVLYCLPVIQTARFSALQVQRSSDSKNISVVAIFCAIAWSLAEAAISWPNLPLSAFLMNVVTRGVTFTIIGRVITKLWKDKEHQRKDWLTGLPDRAELIRYFHAKQLHSDKSGMPFSLLCFNINRFRALNDRLGHQVGDEALKVMAETLLGNTRQDDIVSRTGSDEFVALLSDTDEKTGKMLATRIITAAESKFRNKGWDISLSFGHIVETGSQRSVDEILRDAGEKLYFSKQAVKQNGELQALSVAVS